jgi:CheY-like chemotaxis protein
VGYEVATANSGQEGISLLDSGNEYDLVITDIRMPGMSGNELAKHIRNSDWTYTPIIAISGYHDAVEQELFDGILQKPFKFKILVEKIRILIQKNAKSTMRSCGNTTF